MKQTGWILLGIGVLLCGACGPVKPPIAAAPPDVTPVARVTPQPPQSTPARTQNVVAAPVKQQPAAAQQNRSTEMPAATRAKLGDLLARLEDALFDYDKDSIRADASAALRDDVSVIRNILADYPSQKLTIEGHADERGSAEYNLALGDRRAHNVEEFLSTMGIPAAQLTVITYGKEKPVCTESSEACWQKNRRAHVTAAQ